MLGYTNKNPQTYCFTVYQDNKNKQLQLQHKIFSFDILLQYNTKM